MLAAAPAAGAQQRGDTFDCRLPDGRSVARVVGGRDVRHEQFPWQVVVSVRYKSGRTLCGGSLIGAEWVLTAAHCVDSSKSPGVQLAPVAAVRVLHGASDRHRPEPSAARRGASGVYVHPEYDGDVNHGNDIALLRLSAPIANARASYANLLPTAEAARRFVVAGACAVVTGYGRTQEDGSASRTLRAAALPIVSRRACREAYGSSISAGEVCAGWSAGGRGICQGDSGGPLVVEGLGAGQYLLAGVVSASAGCAQPRRYGVFARVSHYMPWVLQTIRNH